MRAHDDGRYDDENIFAKILRGEIPCHKVYEDDVALAFMDIMPRSPGHCLVIPKVAARNLLDIEPEALSQLISRVQKVAVAAKTALGADGVTLQQFSESAGGQEVFHLHFHVLPRFEGAMMQRHPAPRADHAVLAEQAATIRAAISG
jgi:histidine triad (HIT) family protein